MSDDPEGQEPSALRTQLTEQAQRAALAEARVAELERRDAFRDAGLDLSNPLHQVVAQAYQGDLTPDQVKEHVEKMGLNKPADTTPSPPAIPDAERQALERIAAAGGGDGERAVEPDRAARLRKELDDAFHAKALPSELDRISSELAQAMGNRVVNQ